MNQADSVVIFGGTGFIGTHLAQHLLREQRARNIALVDLAPPRIEPWTTLLQERLGTGQVNFIPGDVRRPIQNPSLPAHADLIVNLAAIHPPSTSKPICMARRTCAHGQPPLVARGLCLQAALHRTVPRKNRRTSIRFRYLIHHMEARSSQRRRFISHGRAPDRSGGCWSCAQAWFLALEKTET